MLKRTVTMKDVAREANVNQSTVSRVLGPTGGASISADVRKRIQRIARSLDYHPNPTAVALRTGATRTVIVVVSDMTDMYYSVIISGVQEVLGAEGYTLVLHSLAHAGLPANLPLLLRQYRFDGLLMLGALPGVTDDIIAMLGRRELPLVLVGRALKARSVPSVTAANREGGRLAAAHLWGLGHRRIAVMRGPREWPDTKSRVEGFRAELSRQGAGAEALHLFSCASRRTHSGFEATEALLKTWNPTAIFCMNDATAVGCMSALRQRPAHTPGCLGCRFRRWRACGVRLSAADQRSAAPTADGTGRGTAAGQRNARTGRGVPRPGRGTGDTGVDVSAGIARRLEGKVILVTGGGTGIGRAICLAAAREGADVAIGCNTSAAGAREVMRQIRAMGRRAETFVADLSRTRTARNLVQRALRAMGALHVLVNNAAIVRRAPFLTFSEKDWDTSFAINLRAAFVCTQEVARAMVRQKIRGRVVNISSVGGKLAHADLCAYDASKAGMDMLTRSVAVELAPLGITVNSVSPGAIEVERNRDEFADASAVRRWKSVIPLGHWGDPQDIANAVIFLASEEARFITGHTLVVDGGQTIALTSPR